MNIKEYHKLIKNPELLSVETLKDIEGLVKNFPMVENFRILLALNLLILDDYRYDNALINAAIYSSDRKRLKEWVDHILNSFEEDQKEPETINESDEVNKDTIEQDEKTHEENNQKEEQIIAQETDIVSDRIENDPTAEQEKIAERDKEDAPEIISEKEEETEITDILAEKKSIRSKKELLKLVRKRLDEIETEKAKEKEAEADNDESFIKAKLIDRFIEQQPSINRPDKNEFFDPQNEAVESSLDGDDFFVTETLAQIHTQQANFKKAEEIYRKLILKYPEKSSYFAAQIEKLTKK